MEKTPKAKLVHPIKELLTYFDQAFRAKFGQPAPIVPGKDAKRAKELLERYAFADLCRWIDAFFVSFDTFIRGSAYTFGVFASCIGKLIAEDRPAEHLTEKSARTLKVIYGS